MHVDINFIAFIEMYYYTLQHLRMCENKGVFFTEGLSKTILYRVQCNLVPACFLVCTFLILSYRAKCFHSVFSFLVVLFAVEFSYHSGHKKA